MTPEDHYRRFPKGTQVVFAHNRMFFTADKVCWDIVGGETQPRLTLRSRRSGRKRYNVKRAHLMAVTDPTVLELAA
jgi:hypothetical protein